MSIQLEIPDSVVQAMRMPAKDKERQLKLELAINLYAQGILSFGKACELAMMSRIEFGLVLSKGDIPRHYDEQDLQDDINY